MELVILFSFSSAVALALGLSSLVARRPARRRLERLSRASSLRASPGEAAGLLEDERRSRLVRLLGPLARRTGHADAASRQTLRRRLLQAGYRRDSALVFYTTSRLALALALPAALLLTQFTWNLGQLQLAVTLCAAAAVGLVIPSWWIDYQRSRRQAEIIIGLPDALDLLLVCIEAGLALQASLARVVSEFARSNEILSEEFELVLLEARAGKSSADALRGLSERTGVSEVSTLVATLIQTERFGTSLGDTLRVHADAMRVRRLHRAEELGAKAPVKMLFPTLLIFIATLMIMVGPGMIQLASFFSSR